MTTVIRRMVSKKKRRFEGGGFDLDLSYITDKIIGLAFVCLLFDSFTNN